MPNRVPIPDDWDGESWRCIQIEWPDSPQYRAVLLGFLSYLTRGRAWNDDTGIITEAQDVGWEIFHRNYPLTDCESGEVITPTPSIGQWDDCAFGCPDDDCPGGCDEMACITQIKIEDGKLYVMYGCCEWTLVGDIDDTVGDLGSAPYEEGDPGPPPSYSGCGKATALVEVLWSVGEAVLDHYGQLPWNFIHAVESDVGYNLNDVNCINLQLQMVIIEGMGGVTGLFDNDVKETLICKIAGWLADDATGLNEDTFKAVTRLIQSQDFGGFSDNVLAQNFWVLAWWAVGKNNANNIAKIGAGVTDAECDCPDQTAPRPDADNVIYDIIEELAPDTASTNNLTIDATNVRVKLSNIANGEENKLVRIDDIDEDMNVAVEEGTFRVYMRPSVANIHPSTEYWLEVELNLHYDSSDTTLTARFENPIVGSYQRITVTCPHTGALTSINIEGHGWYNSGEANEFTAADWYIATAS